MTYAEDRAAEQRWVLVRAYQLDPVAWVSYSRKPKAVKQRVERARDAALSRARLEYDALRASGVEAMEPKDNGMLHQYINSAAAKRKFYERFEKPLVRITPTGRRPAERVRYYMPVFMGAELAARSDKEALPPAFGIEVDWPKIEQRVLDSLLFRCPPGSQCAICYPKCRREYDFSPNSAEAIA